MRFNVEGADVRTGRDRLVTLEAHSPEHAEQIARRHGLLVAAVHEAQIVSPAEKLEQMFAGRTDPATISGAMPVNLKSPTESITGEISSSAFISTRATAKKTVEEKRDPAAESMTPEELEYQTPRSDPLVRFASTTQVPPYNGLRIAGSILSVCAILAYLAGVIAVGIQTKTIFDRWGFYSGSSSGIAMAMFEALIALAPLASGAVLHGMSSACHALRDIARNSWR